MSGYTTAQAERIARQIFDRFGEQIRSACARSIVPKEFLAGFVGVEAGKDRAGNLKPEATRFEPGVFEDLKSLRDNGYCFVGGKKKINYSGVKRSQIQTATNADLRALATSYGLTQIMGWHCINNLQCTIADLRDPDKHLIYAVRLLTLVGGEYLRRNDFAPVLRIWNTGSPTGKTYHASYVPNALAVAAAYKEIQQNTTRKRTNRTDFIEATRRADETDVKAATPQQNPSPASILDKARDVASKAQETIAIVNQAKDAASAVTSVLPGASPSDAITKVTSGKKASFLTFVFSIVFSAVTAVWGFMYENWKLIALAVLAIVVLSIVQILVFTVINALKMKYFSNPARFNVE